MNNHRRRNFRIRSQKTNFRRRSGGISSNGSNTINNNGNMNFNRNGSMNNIHNVEKTMQKYQQLAKDAQSNGDPVLAQNYLQHADHFTRILNERESFKREKFLESRSENDPEVIDDIDENLEKNSENKSLDASSDETKIQKTAKTQVEVN